MTYNVCVASLPFATPLPWPQVIINDSMNGHFKILQEVVSNLGTFCLEIYKYNEYSRTTLFIYSFSPTI